MAECNLCNKRVQNHSLHLICDICHCKVHLKCLPMVNRNDNIFVDRHNNNWFCTKCTSDIFVFGNIDDDTEYLKTI